MSQETLKVNLSIDGNEAIQTLRKLEEELSRIYEKTKNVTITISIPSVEINTCYDIDAVVARISNALTEEITSSAKVSMK